MHPKSAQAWTSRSLQVGAVDLGEGSATKKRSGENAFLDSLNLVFLSKITSLEFGSRR